MEHDVDGSRTRRFAAYLADLASCAGRWPPCRPVDELLHGVAAAGGAQERGAPGLRLGAALTAPDRTQARGR
jgi:hypothetical protein